MFSHSKMAAVLLVASVLMVEHSTIAAEAVSAGQAPLAADKAVQAMPEMKDVSSDGAKRQCGVFFSDKTLLLNPGNPLKLDLSIGGKAVGSISYWGETKFGYGSPFPGGTPEVNYDPAGKAITVKKKFRAGSADTLDGEFTLLIKLSDDGLIDLKYGYSLPEGVKVTSQKGLFNFNPEMVAGAKLSIDGKTSDFSKKTDPPGNRTVFDGCPGEIVFSPECPEKCFRMILDGKHRVWIQENRKGNKDETSISIYPNENGDLNFRLDIRNTAAAKK